MRPANTPEEYVSQLPDDRRSAISKLRTTIKGSLPRGFEETMSYGMIGYVVPLKVYPKGYHAQPGEPLPFMNLASFKSYISLYHFALYMNEDLLEWFKSEYAKRSTTTLDLGKSCIRFRNMDDIPYDLVAELCAKISLSDFLDYYESGIDPSHTKTR